MPALRTILPQVVLFFVFGVWLPWQKGIGFLDSVILGAYACLGVLFAAPQAASGISVVKAVRTGVGWSWAMLVTGIATVYLTRTIVVGPDLRTLAECALFGIALTTAGASIAAFASANGSPRTAKLVARAMLLGLLALFYLRAAWLPDVAWMGAAICSGIAALFLCLLHRTQA